MKEYGRYDAVIVGAGVAGLTVALYLAPLKILVIAKNNENNSRYAQGGIAAAISNDDNPEDHFKDTLKASAGSSNQILAKLLTESASDAIDFLIKKGVLFDRYNDGSFKLNQEGSHSKARVLRAGGDSIGTTLIDCLINAVKQAEHIDYQEGWIVKDLITEKNLVTGLVAIDHRNDWNQVESNRIILATGGAGQVFSHTTNPKESTGDGIAIAKRANVKLAQMEMIQFHPTALETFNRQERMPLITEALRGAGAKLVNKNKKRIMEGVHPQRDLAPRDIVAREIWKYIFNKQPIFLDATNIAKLEEDFPTVTKSCLEHGIDPKTQLIPITPAAHYLMGGIKTDQNGKSNLSGLWAVGECAGSGVHGANRLASNSLLECIVFGKRVAKSAANYNLTHQMSEVDIPKVYNLTSNEIAKIRNEIQTMMFSYLGLVRNESAIKIVTSEIIKIEQQINKTDSPDQKNIRELIELENILENAKSICHAAFKNQCSRGAHFLVTRSHNEYTISSSI